MEDVESTVSGVSWTKGGCGVERELVKIDNC